MSRRALAEKRPYLLLSVLAALAYFYLRPCPECTSWQLPEGLLFPIKGSACAFLAFYAWLRHGSSDARLLAGAMAVASVADMVLMFHMQAGAAVFILFHLLAIRLFTRHNRGAMSTRDNMVLLALLIVPPFAGYLLPAEELAKWLATAYGAFLGVMAASAWASTFPRLRVAAGAILFVLSDLLIFAAMGPLEGSDIPEYLVWPIYYLAQLLIATGVVTTLRKRDPELRVVQGGKETLH